MARKDKRTKYRLNKSGEAYHLHIKEASVWLSGEELIDMLTAIHDQLMDMIHEREN
jgi:hypothetical protein